MDKQEMSSKLNNNTIENYELITCPQNGDIYILGLSLLKVIERKYCSEEIVKELVNLSKSKNKLIGHINSAILL